MRNETSQAGFTVKLVRSDVEVFVPEYGSILQVLLSLGFAIPYSCRGGSCGACEVGVLRGTPDHRDLVLSDDEKASNQSMMVWSKSSPPKWVSPSVDKTSKTPSPNSKMETSCVPPPKSKTTIF